MSRGSERRVRNRALTIRLTDDERAAVEAHAERSGLTAASYARRTLLGTTPPRQVRRPIIERKLLARLLGELGHIGANLSQIARAANRGQSVDRIGLVEDLQGLRRMRDAVLDALGRAP